VLQMKNRMLTVLHIVIWVAGTAFLITGSFHGNLWFDETYSAGIINHNLFDIIRISSGDVHPPFYYILLKVFSAVFGKSLLSLRLFSVLFASLLAGLGFTHLRRDFGEKLGFLYTTLMFLFAVTFKYANEIRMYTLAPYLVTLMAIYAYRYYKSGFADKKSGILFLVLGILGAYTHYYAFAAAGAVNLLLLLHCKKSGMLNIWKKTAVIQLAAYIPGFYFLLTQTTRVVGGFWISMRYPDFVLNSLSFFMIGDVPEDAVGLTEVSAIVFNALAFVFWSVCVFYYIRYYKKNPQKSEPAALTLKVLAIIIMFYFAVSLIRPLYYVRYLTVLSGLIVFFLAFAIDRISKPII
jgi:uncharacterized membrane protein